MRNVTKALFTQVVKENVVVFTSVPTLRTQPLTIGGRTEKALLIWVPDNKKLSRSSNKHIFHRENVYRLLVPKFHFVCKVPLLKHFLSTRT